MSGKIPGKVRENSGKSSGKSREKHVITKLIQITVHFFAIDKDEFILFQCGGFGLAIIIRVLEVLFDERWSTIEKKYTIIRIGLVTT